MHDELRDCAADERALDMGGSDGRTAREACGVALSVNDSIVHPEFGRIAME